ncbi:hypothetical protein CLF_113169, partial [Clonorchis sinensis]
LQPLYDKYAVLTADDDENDDSTLFPKMHVKSYCCQVKQYDMSVPNSYMYMTGTVRPKLPRRQSALTTQTVLVCLLRTQSSVTPNDRKHSMCCGKNDAAFAYILRHDTI